MKNLLLFLSLTVYFAGINELCCQNISNGILDSKEVPFEMVKNTIVIPVQIDGTTYQFVLDTGGLFTISKKLQSIHQFNQTGQIDISDINGKELAFNKVKVKEIAIGELVFKGREAIVSFDNELYPNVCYGTDGMIGRDFFEGMILQFDYAQKVIRLTEEETAFQLDDQYKTELKISNRGLPDVLLTIDGEPKFIEFDSGSGDFFSYKTKEAKKKKVAFKKDKLKFKGIFSFGVSSRKIKSSARYKLKINSFQLASTEFKNFYSDFSKVSAPRVGASILYYGRVTVDYKNLGFYFEPFPETNKIPPLKSFGFDIAYLNGEYLIKWVLKKSIADKEGLQLGFEIKSIDGSPIAQIANECEGYINGYSFHQKDNITLEYYNSKGQLLSIFLQNDAY